MTARAAGVFDDGSAERRALMNVLEDAESEKQRLSAAQRAIMNILEDFADEKRQLELGQRATLNLLEEIDTERARAEAALLELRQTVESLRKAKAAVEAANKELDAFSYSAAHDLRAPLRGIEGFSEALLEEYDDKLEEQGRVYLRHVQACARQMAELIEGLLTLSRLARGELQRAEVDLSELARNTLDRLQSEAPGRHVEIVVQDGISAIGDKRLLGAALDNLLGNAWKFTAKRAAGRVEFGARASDGVTAYFVRDNGVGFDMQYAGKLFGVFQRLHSAQEFEGTGIGLATVERIVRRHGGSVWAESAPDRGATFYFTLGEERSQ
ncbi:MAG: ATP-binding protein [Candidatus Baltobacteraceae bacterium]|jgi:light-regulated signal transduction histidine kinase (bacteriophytochrome)